MKKKHRYLPTRYIDNSTGEVFEKRQLENKVYKVIKRKRTRERPWEGAEEYWLREIVLIDYITEVIELELF